MTKVVGTIILGVIASLIFFFVQKGFLDRFFRDEHSQQYDEEIIPQIEVINTTYANNDDVIQLLKENDGETVFLDTINMDLAISENTKIYESCFSDDMTFQEELGQGKLNGKSLPIPTSTFNELGCFVFLELDSLDRRPYIFSSGGTGIVNYLIRKRFLVNMQVIGSTTTFNLREVQ